MTQTAFSAPAYVTRQQIKPAHPDTALGAVGARRDGATMPSKNGHGRKELVLEAVAHCMRQYEAKPLLSDQQALFWNRKPETILISKDRCDAR
jgi:hypothetical protein